MNEIIVRDSPLNFVDVRVVPYEAGEASLADICQAVLPAEVEFALSVNGRLIPGDLLSSVFPAPADVIVCTPVLGDGDVMRVVAMIAVVVVSAYTGGALGAAYGSFYGALGATAVAVSGGLLVNALLPPPTPRIPAGLEKQSQTYSWQPQTTQQQGIPIPRHYGVNKLYGNVIAWHRELVGEKQYLNILLCLGIGPYKRLYDFEINDQPLSLYQGVKIETRLGDLNQTPVAGFNDTKIEYPLSVRVSKRSATIQSGSTTTRIKLPDGKGALFDVLDAVIVSSGGGETVVVGKASEVTGTDGLNYQCIKNHTSSSSNKPITGASWSVYWAAGGTNGEAWASGKSYKTYSSSDTLIVAPALPTAAKAGETLSITQNYYIYTSVGALFDGLEVDILFPQGIWRINDSGTLVNNSVEVKVEIRKQGESLWRSISQQATAGGTSSSYWSAGMWGLDAEGQDIWIEYVRGTNAPGDHYWGQPLGALLPGETRLLVYSGPAADIFWYWIDGAYVATAIQDSFVITAKIRGELRRTFLARNLTHGVYEIKVSNLTDYKGTDRYGEDMYLSAVREVLYDDFQYPRHVLVGIRSLAQEQLSGSMRFSCLAEGAKVRIWDGAQWSVDMSDNPAWVKYDIITRPVFDNNLNVLRYDGYDPARMDTAKWKELADFCNELKPKDDAGGTEKRVLWNGGFDALTNVWAAVMQISDLDRSIPIHNGLQLSLAIDQPQTPRQLFTVGNIERSSFKRSWLPTAERASSITATFVNREGGYERDELSVLNPDIDTDMETHVQLFGETRPSGVWRNLRWRLANNQYVLESAEITVFVESLVSVIGDVIYLQYDVPLIGAGGRLAAATSSSVTLDREVTIEAGKSYQVMVSLTQPSVVVGTDGQNYMCRISHVSAAATRPITGASWSAYWTQTAEAGEAWTSGKEYWQPGAAVLKNVANAPGTYTTLNITGTYTKTPSPYDVYAFGETNNVTREYRIVDMTPTMDFRCALTLSIYDANLYTIDDAVFIPPEFTYVQIDTLPPVTGLTLNEAILLDESKGTVRVITLSYRWPAGDSGRMISRVRLYYREGAGNWMLAGETTGEEFRVEGVSPNTLYRFAVCSVNVVGQEAKTQNSPQASITTSGALPVSVPQNIQVNNIGTEVAPGGALVAVVQISWDNNPTGELVTNYEIVYNQV